MKVETAASSDRRKDVENQSKGDSGEIRVRSLDANEPGD